MVGYAWCLPKNPFGGPRPGLHSAPVRRRTRIDTQSNMSAQQQKTYSARPEDITHNWWVVDAEGMVLGRLAAEVAKVIRGKHKPMYTPHMDTGDYVVVINASKVRRSSRPSPTCSRSTPSG